MHIHLEPIGHVRNDHPEGQKPLTWHGIRSRIEFDPRWVKALSGLSGFSHMITLCYLHLIGEQSPDFIRPQRNPEMPRIGFFGTRTPARPNPIAVTVVELERIDGHILHVRNLDMYDGTPVLDVKPYLLRGDCNPQAAEPDWIRRLRAIQDERRQQAESE
jgi:tRNA-Thr(GGU) m(6)t(6)A37 methyltransferase TsaA